MGKIHNIEPGESVASLAEITGHSPETIWLHPENEALRSRRDNMNILADNDKLFIPEIQSKTLPCATAMRHRFRRVGVPALYRLHLLLNGQPRKNLRYVLVFEDKVIESLTDERGVFEVFVHPLTSEILLFIGNEEIPRILKIGELEPTESIAGMQQRLQKLGYHCPLSGSLDENTKNALLAFQGRAGMAPTGDADAITIAALRRAHDEIGEPV